MSFKDAITAASRNFVRSDFRERFIHEALRKPEKLMGRICHEIYRVFDEQFKGGKCAYEIEENCFLFSLTGRITETTWAEALEHVKSHGGGGYLIIDVKGNGFYAQSEGFPPPVTFAGRI